MSTNQIQALEQARAHLHDAQFAFAAFMALLAEAQSPLEPEQLYKLLAPIEGEYQAARECLEVCHV